jgi:calcium/calmodulin-dependent protein kinase I
MCWLFVLTETAKQYQKYQIFVEFFGWYENPEFIFLAMEYFPMGDLSMHISKDIQEHDLKDISSQLLEGLKLMHAECFTHRDLKPQVWSISFDPYAVLLL